MPDLGLPTDRVDWRRMAATSRRVLGRPRWLAVALLGAVGTLSLFALPPNFGYVKGVVLGGSLPLASRAAAFAELYPPVDGNVLRGLALWTVGGLVGVNLALFGYHVTEHEVGVREGGGSTAGVALAALGAGCPACGIGIAGAVLSTAGVTGGLAVLPLHGGELLVLAALVATLSIHWTVEGMRGGDVRGCPVDTSE